MKHVIQIHMTNACNLKCEYCYINQNSKKLTFDVLKKQIKNIQYLSKKIDDGARYYENIGKLMFEFILLGKESQYLPKNKKFYDGLSEYMNYLDLDDNNTYIFTNKEKQYFEEKLFMQSNDEFLSLF